MAVCWALSVPRCCSSSRLSIKNKMKMEATGGLLLCELQEIWDKIGRCNEEEGEDMSWSLGVEPQIL
ncbi:hypothetical protein Droror1_Dr00012035, partial [Drosera rotundifolia]